MPWAPRYSEAEARQAIANASTWKDVIDALVYSYFGKNIKTLRKWAAKWGIPVDHLPNGRSGAAPRYNREQAAEAIGRSRSWAEALRRLGYCHTGANARPLQQRAARWGISSVHFDPYAASRDAIKREAPPLATVLVRNSTYSRASLKRRLFETGMKARRCELCGQGELWRGKKMGLILDRVNGVRDDNRIDNLRIVCPNCAATLDTIAVVREPARRWCRERASAAKPPLRRNIAGSDTAHGTAGLAGTAAESSVPALERLSVLPEISCWRRSMSTGTWALGADMACRTTRYENGFANTSASAP